MWYTKYMEDILKQDIFFFITTVSVVVLTILLVIAAVYIIKIVKDIKFITRKAKDESELLSEDLKELRQNVRTEGAKMKHFAKFLTNIYKRHK